MSDAVFNTTHKLWCELVDKDDRTSPEEYPDHCLITFDELHDYIKRALAELSNQHPR